MQNEYAQAQFVDMNSKPSLTIDTSFVLVGHSNAGDNSGGEQEKLMAFCLAGALSFNLANPKAPTTHRFSRG